VEGPACELESSLRSEAPRKDEEASRVYLSPVALEGLELCDPLEFGRAFLKGPMTGCGISRRGISVPLESDFAWAWLPDPDASPKRDVTGELTGLPGAGVFVLDIHTPSTSIPLYNALIPKGT